MTLDIKDRLYTSSEVAEILGVSLRSVYRYLEEGKLDADIKTATGRHRFSKKNILDFLKPGSSSEASTVEPVKSVEFSKPIENKTFSPSETVDEEFDFDNFFETGIVKKNPIIQDIQQENRSSVSSKPDFLDDQDDLEKLFDELEKEFSETKNLENQSDKSLERDKQISKIVEDDFDFDFDFLDGKETVDEYLNVSKTAENGLNKRKEDDFDFDFDFLEKEIKSEEKEAEFAKTEIKKNDDNDDFDFLNLDDLFEDMQLKPSSEKEEKPKEEARLIKQEPAKELEVEEPEPDNWLEKFRKASEKMSTPEPRKEDEAERFSLDNFFNKETPKPSPISKVSEDEFIASRQAKKKEYYYISSLSGLKEIAQTVDKVSKKFDLDYAFTLNAGLSLHKPISPFSVINVYINEGDLEIFEDYLKLTPSSEKDAQICLMMVRDREIFDDSYELHGLYVVSNVQLRSDFIDKGLDNLAREV
jgi:excisionase family DNA binding protein